MMLRFQEDTARHLFRMQILAPDGTPIETAEQLTALQAAHSAPAQLPPTPSLPRPAETSWQPEQAAALPAIPTRAPSTTIDALEREFERKKQNDLNAAKMAGGSAANGSTPQRSGPTVGRNEPCFCGSGKKYKKCHGANA